MQLDLYWQAQKPLGFVYGFNVRLQDTRGRMWNTLEVVRPMGWRFIPGTDFWPPDKYILDNYAVRPLPGTPPGTYHLEVVAFQRDTLEALETAAISPLHISMPDRSSYSDVDPLAIMADGRLALMDLIFDRGEAVPGDLVGVHAVWHSEGGIASCQVQLVLVAPGGDTSAIFEFPLGEGYPPSIWNRGDFLRDQYIFRLPAELSTGEFEWQLKLRRCGINPTDEYRSDATLNVVSPDRLFTAPFLTERLNSSMGDQMWLVGYSLRQSTYRPDDILDITLVWQAKNDVSAYYHVFLHLLDVDGHLAAQSDGEPADWSRPTTGWLPGEFVSDQHTLQLPGDLPSGVYSLRTGLYNPETGERVATSFQEDGSVLVSMIEIGVR